MKLDADAATQHAGSRRETQQIAYPILGETHLSSRWNLAPKTLQRWRSEGIGPPAWRIGKSARYLLIEVDAFERRAMAAWKSSAGRVPSG